MISDTFDKVQKTEHWDTSKDQKLRVPGGAITHKYVEKMVFILLLMLKFHSFWFGTGTRQNHGTEGLTVKYYKSVMKAITMFVRRTVERLSGGISTADTVQLGRGE